MIDKIRDYNIISLIGNSPAGKSYLAEDSRKKRFVIRIFNKEYISDENLRDYKKLFIQLKELNHKIIQTPSAIFTEFGLDCVLTDYIDGKSVAAILADKQNLPEVYIRKLIKPLLAGLNHAHEHGLFHGHIKPSNIYITSDGSVKILDLGIPVIVKDQESGTENFIPGNNFRSVKTDIYQAGVFCIEAALGKLPSGIDYYGISDSGAVSEIKSQLTGAGFNRDFTDFVLTLMGAEGKSFADCAEALSNLNSPVVKESVKWSSAKAEIQEQKQTAPVQTVKENVKIPARQDKPGVNKLIFLAIPVILILAFVSYKFLFSESSAESADGIKTVSLAEISLTATASSYSRQAYGFNFKPENLVDKNPRSAWVPFSADKNFSASWLKIDFSEEINLEKFYIINGFHYPDWSEGDLYWMNSRLTNARIEFSDGSSTIVYLREADEVQEVKLDKSYKTSFIRLIPLEWTRGSKWNDLCISEISLVDFDMGGGNYRSDNNGSGENNGNVPGIYPEASTRLLTYSDIKGKHIWDVLVMRNEIYARYGYIFKLSRELKDYFESQPWYTPRVNDVGAIKLTDIERQNVDFLLRNTPTNFDINNIRGSNIYIP